MTTMRNCGRLLAAVGAAMAVTTAASAQPSNDLCSAASVVTAGSNTNATNVGATSDVASTTCAFTPTDNLDVWFSFTPATSGDYLIDTNGSVVLDDTTLSIWSACGGTQLYCDDDGGFGLLSSLLVPLTGGTTYLIRVAGWDGGVGAFRLNVSNPVGTGGSDVCGTATAVSAGNAYYGDNTIATSDVAATSCSVNDSLDVWFSFSPPSSAFYNINTNGSPVLDDTTLSIWSACGGTQLFCDDDTGAGFLSELNVQLSAGTTYLIRVAGYDGASGQFLLSIGSPVAPPSAPSNDNCAGATVITTLPFNSVLDIAGATADADIASCNDPAATAIPNGVWYTYTPAGNQTLRLIEQSPFNTFFSVFTSTGGCGGTLTEVAGSCGFNETIPVTGGTQYFILVGAGGTAPLAPPTTINLLVEAIVPPANDTCAGATTATAGSTYNGDTSDASSDVAESTCSALDDIDVWYRFRPTATDTYTIDTVGSTTLDDTTLSIWDSCGPTATELYCNDDIDLAGDNLLSSITASLTQDVDYFIRVSGYAGLTGAYQLNISGTAPLTGACCSGTQCLTVDAATCTGANTAFRGPGTVCNAPGNNTTPCCKADYNQAGGVTVQDIFDFLTGYFSNSSQADINAVGGVTVQDIFDFLAAYFAGCA